MNILELAKQNEDLVISLRRHLHQYPELTGMEFETLRFIKSQLDLFGISYIEVENGGILGFLGDKNKGKSVLLRADMDALPMDEAKNNTKYPKLCPISKTPGVAHTCGHDAHTAMLLATGKILKEHENEINGQIILCFERGEEGGYNIEHILRYIEKEKIKIDACHAMHIATALPTGKISVLYGPVTSGCFSYDITLTGKGGHGSRPDLSNNPLDCFHAIYSDIQAIPMRNINPYDPTTIAICKVDYGTTWNIIAPTLNFAGNARFFSRETSGLTVKKRLLEIVEHNAKIYGCTYTINSTQGPSLGITNNKECVDVARAGISKNLGATALMEQDPEFASETMALMLRLYPGVYCMIGVGNPDLGITAVPHNPMFDIDEDALVTGVATNISFAMEFLSSNCTPIFNNYNGGINSLLKALEE